MIVLVSGLFGLRTMAGHPFWDPIAQQLDHVKWEGIRFYDLIQPAFIFMSGVAIPFAMAKRTSMGFGFGRNFLHVLIRALKLIASHSYSLSCIGRRFDSDSSTC